MGEFLRSLLKVAAALIGLPLTLVGFVGFWVGVYMALSEDDPSQGVSIVAASAVAFVVATYFGKFARGVFD